MHDVIVVGAGIGGAAAAYFLGSVGQRVLVLEKEALPRYKACGGGVPKSVFRRFPFPFDQVMESEITVDPFLGEGIRYAVRSANLAAEAIVRDDLKAHTPGVQQKIGVGLCRARWLARLFYGLPRFCFLWGVRNPRMVQTFADMLDERASYFDISKHIPLALFGISKSRAICVKPSAGEVVRRKQ